MDEHGEDMRPGPGGEPPDMSDVTADGSRRRADLARIADRVQALGRPLATMNTREALAARATLEHLAALGPTDEALVDFLHEHFAGVVEDACSTAGLDLAAIRREIRSQTGQDDDATFAGVFLAFAFGMRAERDERRAAPHA